MWPLVTLLGLFAALGLAQIAFAGRVVDLIHGGPGRREPRMRRFDVLVLRVAGAFMLLLSVGGLAAAALLTV